MIGHTWRIEWRHAAHAEAVAKLYYAPTAADAVTMWQHDATRLRSYPAGTDEIETITWLEGVYPRG